MGKKTIVFQSSKELALSTVVSDHSAVVYVSCFNDRKTFFISKNQFQTQHRADKEGGGGLQLVCLLEPSCLATRTRAEGVQNRRRQRVLGGCKVVNDPVIEMESGEEASL